MNNKFGARLKEARDDMGLSTEELGEKARTTKATISRYENGIHEPKSQMIAILSEILGVSAAWLMGMSEEKYGASIVAESTSAYNVKTQIPVFSSISAGQSLSSKENVIGFEYSNDCDFCLRIIGDSMKDARILDGDIVFVKSQSDIESGEIAVVAIGEKDASLARIYKYSNGDVRLHYGSNTEVDQLFSKKEFKQVKILGKAKYLKSEIR